MDGTHNIASFDIPVQSVVAVQINQSMGDFIEDVSNFILLQHRQMVLGMEVQHLGNGTTRTEL